MNFDKMGGHILLFFARLSSYVKFSIIYFFYNEILSLFMVP